MAEAENDQLVEDVEESGGLLDMNVQLEDVGPCKKHVRISVSRDSIDGVYDELLQEFAVGAEVPGFRVGHVPVDLIRKRFKTEIGERVKQRVLMASLEQLGDDTSIEPISEPNLDLDSIELPDEGDFEFEFDVEVRPQFDLPNYKGLKIERPQRETSDADIDAYLEQFTAQYGKLTPVETPAEAGDFVTVNIETSFQGQPLASIDDVSIRVRRKLAFRDAELDGFDAFIQGASAGDVRETDIPVSMEAESIEMRGESVHIKFTVLDVKRLEVPELDESLLSRMGAESLDDLRRQVRGMLERQVRYEQRQSVRRQVLEQITESADWDLPEDLVRKQVENALRREVLEMEQAGFTSREILARENDLRQRSLTMTRKNLKEHFVLDRIAESEKVEVSDSDLEVEITMMAMQRGESPRRVRARLIKSGMIENLQAQIRERKAVDVILDGAEFIDTPLPAPVETEVEALNRSVCRSVAAQDTNVEQETDE